MHGIGNKWTIASCRIIQTDSIPCLRTRLISCGIYDRPSPHHKPTIANSHTCSQMQRSQIPHLVLMLGLPCGALTSSRSCRHRQRWRYIVPFALIQHRRQTQPELWKFPAAFGPAGPAASASPALRSLPSRTPSDAQAPWDRET